MARNDQNWDQRSSSNRDWEQSRNRYNINDDYRNDEGYSNVNSGYRSQNEEASDSRNLSNDHRQSTGAYNDHYGRSENWNRNQMQSMSGYNDQDDWNDRNRNYNNEPDSLGRNDYGRRGYVSGDYGDRSGHSGYTGASGYSSNRGYSNRDRDYDNRRSDRDRDWWDRTKDEVSSWFGDDEAQRRRHMDEVSGPHRGKGPKDYQRSEDRIREDVCDRLSDDDRIDASNVQVKIENNEVILTGTVHSKEEKRRAEDLVESISGVRNVENRLRVSDRSDDSLFGGRSSSDRTTGTDATRTERNKNR